MYLIKWDKDDFPKYNSQKQPDSKHTGTSSATVCISLMLLSLGVECGFFNQFDNHIEKLDCATSGDVRVELYYFKL